MRQDLIELEERGWQVLSSGKDAAQKFYATLLADDAVMLFPGGVLMEGKEKILESLSAQPWRSFEMTAPKVIRLSENAGVVVYRIVAEREDRDPYIALIS